MNIPKLFTKNIKPRAQKKGENDNNLREMYGNKRNEKKGKKFKTVRKQKKTRK